MATVVSVTAVALTGLVVEGALRLVDEKTGVRPDATHDVPRLMWWLLTITVLLIVVWYRSRLAHTKGTLYYVRYLREWMADSQIVDEREHSLGHLDARVIAKHVTAERP